MNRFHNRARMRALTATTAAALGATALFAVPAGAAPGCDGLAGNDFEFEDELTCAAGADSTEYVITLTQDFDVSDFSFNFYVGTAALTIQGANPSVTITGPGTVQALLFDNPVYDWKVGSFLAAQGSGTAPITVRDLILTDFGAVGAIVNDSTRALTLSNVTIADSGAGRDFDVPDDAPGLDQGSAVWSRGDVTVIDSHFENNQSWMGGALSTYSVGANDSPDVTITESTFVGNTGLLGGAAAIGGVATISASNFNENLSEGGGALYAFGPTTITDSTFARNAAPTVFDGQPQPHGSAGAILANANLTITGSTFVDNSAAGWAGAISASDLTSLTPYEYNISDTVFDGNASGYGGGALELAGRTTLTNVTVQGHTSRSTIYTYGPLVASGLTMSDNSARDGDAMMLANGRAGETISITNSTFADNGTTADAPAVDIDTQGSVEVVYSTFAGNASAGGNGASLAVDADQGAHLTANAWAATGSALACSLVGDVTSSYNFDPDGSCTGGWAGEGDIGEGLDALLGTLADNGGATQTLLPLEGSPLIDAVPAGITDLTVDQRGIARPQGDGYDIGAVEVVPVVDEDDDSDGGEQPPSDGGTDNGGTDEDDATGDSIAFQVKTDGGVLYGTATAAVAVTDINWTSTANLTGAPANTALPYGAAGFTVEVPEPGASVTVTLTAPKPFTSAYKVSGDSWTAIPGATFSADGTTVTYTLTDGGDLDEDGQANGYIVDPVALAVQATFTG